MLHRAMLGSFERFIGILIEQFAGEMPPWLAPVQAVVLSITDDHREYAEQVRQELADAGIRVEADVRGEKLGYKVREAELAKTPYMLVVGAREIENEQVAVRTRQGNNLGAMPVAAFIERIQEDIGSKV